MKQGKDVIGKPIPLPIITIRSYLLFFSFLDILPFSASQP